MVGVMFRGVMFGVAFAAVAHAQAGDGKDPAGTVQAPPPEWLEIPPAPVLSPDAERATFVLDPDYAIELVASEPMVEDPVAVVFDAAARLWVVEMRAFMPDADANGEREPNGRIVVLEDKDGDGRMDTRTVFADGLPLPRAVLPLGDGAALVLSPPDILLCRDRDGDLVADTREPIGITYPNGFADPEHAANTPTFGLDGWIDFAKLDRRLRWNGTSFESAPSTVAGQWGLSLDDEGRFYHDSNSDYLRGHFASPHYGARHPYLNGPAFLNQRIDSDQVVFPARINPGVNRGYQKNTLREDGRLWRYTGACAPVVYRGDWMPALHGDVFVAEPCGNLVRRAQIERDGAGLRGRNAYPDREFLASTDERFRPVNFSNGPDGALYVVDLYRGLIQHKNYVTTFLRRQVDARGLATPIHMGRIWRVRPKDGERRSLVRVDDRSDAELARLCAQDNGHLRDLAQRELVRRGARGAAPNLRATAGDSGSEFAALQALWTLDGLGALDLGTLVDGLDHLSAAVRAAAVRLCEKRLATGHAILLARLLARVREESSPRVALQMALSLGEVTRFDATARASSHAAMTDLALRFGEHAAVRDAVLSGLYGEELAFILAWQQDPRAATESPGSTVFLRRLAQCVARAREAGTLGALLDHAANDAVLWRTRAVLTGIADVMPKPNARKITVSAEPPALAVLRDHADEAVRAASERITQALETKPTASAPLDAESQALVQKGAGLFAIHCSTCHQASGAGLAGLAPPLRDSEWVLGEPTVLARIVLRGLTGPIEVAGETYELPLMPDHARLADDEIAAILSHLRRAWDHEASIIPPSLITTERAATATRTQPFTVEALR